MAVKHFPMRTQRALVAANPLHFGRGRLFLDERVRDRGWGVSEDARLFAMTFVGGFLFVSILVA
jgi:hypothetical protein